MSEEGRAVADALKAAQATKLKRGVAQVQQLLDQLADIGTSIKSAYKVMGDAGLDLRVVKEIIKRAKRDDRQIALFDMTLLQYENTLGRQRKLDLAEPEKEPEDVDLDEGDEKVVPIKGKAKDKPKGGRKKKPDADAPRAAAADAAPPPTRRGFKNVTPRMSAKDYRKSQGLDDDAQGDDQTTH